MAFCLAELHLWSTKSSLQVRDTDIGTYQYYDKGETGYSWTQRNRQPEKLRDSLKELEELLQTKTCVRTRWINKHCCQVMLSSGILVTLTLNGPQLDQVFIDHTLVGRLPANTVTDAVLSDRLIVLSFLEQGQVAAVYLHQKNLHSTETGRPTDKLSPSEIKVVSVDVSGRRLHRSVCLNHVQDVALCWWGLEQPSEEPCPPSPTHTQWNNLLLLSCSAAEGLQVLSSIRTEGNPLDCRFSLLQPYRLLTVELPAGSREGSWADTCVYECARECLQRLCNTRIPLPSQVVCCSRHPSETSLLLGLSNSSLVLYDQRRGVSFLASCPVPPSLLAWHPAGALAVVGAGQGELLCFDVGLAPVNMALVAEEVAPSPELRLAQYLRCSGGLQGLHWGKSLEGGPEGTDLLMLAFHRGPLAALDFKLGAVTGGRMGPGEMLQQRLRCGQVREALGILGAMDWSIMGDQCYRGLSSVINHLLRVQLNAEREAQLEAVLGMFYAPPSPLSDMVILEYKEPISKYARRFFHHLVRHQRFEKAFLLAVDLEDSDLFMDLHYGASDKGEVVLADVAKRKANEIEAQVIVAGNEDLLRGKNSGLSCFSDRQREKNQTATSPLYPGTPTTHADGGSNQRQAESVRVTVNPDVLRTTRLTVGSSQRDGEHRNEENNPEMLHVVHLGMV